MVQNCIQKNIIGKEKRYKINFFTFLFKFEREDLVKQFFCFTNVKNGEKI